MKTHEGLETIKGRSGLNIPIPSEKQEWDTFDLLDYFRSLQTINGLDISRFYGSGERNQPRSFHNTLFIGKTGVKPLVLIKGVYEARVRSDVEYELRRNRERQEWGQWTPAISGQERHALFVSPHEQDENPALFDVRYTLTEGGSGHSWFGEPSLIVRGEYKKPNDFAPNPNNYTEENQALGRLAYSDYLKQTVDEVVALLS